MDKKVDKKGLKISVYAIMKDEEQFFDQVECNCDNLTQKIAMIGIKHPSIKHLYQEK